MLKELLIYTATAIPVRPPIGLILTAFLLVGCNSTNYREDSRYIYQAYVGTQLPSKEQASVWWDKGGLIVNIDGEDLYICDNPYNCYLPKYPYMGAYLLPGEHTFEYQIQGRKTNISAVFHMKANLLANHEYEFSYDKRFTASSHYDYAARLVDKNTDLLVAGRSPDVFEWSWLDLEKVLQKMVRNSETEAQAIELLSEPTGRMLDNTFVYVACKKVKGVIVKWNDAETLHTRFSPRACGFLFIRFDEASILQDYAYIDAHFRDCYWNPFSAWDVDTVSRKADACRLRLRNEAYAKFHVLVDKTSDRP
jgi:hypothetical protein